jgi:magnesium chelatase family protein
MLAERLPGILPPLDTAAAIEVTSIRSVAGMPAPGSGLVTVPPFCAAHYTSSMASMIGGGSGLIRPGQVSRSHTGACCCSTRPSSSTGTCSTPCGSRWNQGWRPS